MYRTIEAMYDNGRIIPLEDGELNIKKGKILITVLEEDETDKNKEAQVQSLRGVLNNYADPELIKQEDSAWKMSVVNKNEDN